MIPPARCHDPEIRLGAGAVCEFQKLRVSSGAKACIFFELNGTAEAVPHPKSSVPLLNYVCTP